MHDSAAAAVSRQEDREAHSESSPGASSLVSGVSGVELRKQREGRRQLSYQAGVEPMGTAGMQQACTVEYSRHAFNVPVCERRFLLCVEKDQPIRWLGQASFKSN